MKCIAEVRQNTSFARYRRCCNEAIGNTLYCGVHAPEAVSRRKTIRDNRFNKKMDAWRAEQQARQDEKRDAARYRALRDDNAYLPEENGIRGGEALDKLCDEIIRGEY